jgi:hypothetical protein
LPSEAAAATYHDVASSAVPGDVIVFVFFFGVLAALLRINYVFFQTVT